MIGGKENVLYDKAYAFAVRIVKAYQFLSAEKREYVLSKQLLRCGTSIGANVTEANGAISDADFSAKYPLLTRSVWKPSIGLTYCMTLILFPLRCLTACFKMPMS